MSPVEPPIRELVRILNELEIPFVVGGSFASGAWGNPRQTNDLDIAVMLGLKDVAPLLQCLGDDWMVSQEEILSALEESEEYRGFQLIHIASVFKVDVFVPHRSGYRTACFARAVAIDILGVAAPCLSAEDIVIQKLRWFELGNRVSDRQWNDIVQVVEIQGQRLDRGYLAHWSDHFGLGDLLESALKQARS